MARAPASMAMASPPPGGGMGGDPSGGMGGADPSAGGDAGADMDDSSGDVVVTITKTGDGSYMVYAGDEPDSSGGSGDMSDDDADAMGAGGGASGGAGDAGGMGGAAGGMSAPQGQPASSIGAALKIAMDILQGDASSEGAPGSEDDQMAAGYSASQSPTPASGPAMKQKY